MNLICAIFGHSPEKAYGGQYSFFVITAPWHDGIGRSHRNILSQCSRCGRKFQAGKTIDPYTNEKLKKEQIGYPFKNLRAGIILGSKTYDATAVVAALGMLVQNLPMLQEQLGNSYGYVFIAFSVLFAYLRKITTGPVGNK